MQLDCQISSLSSFPGPGLCYSFAPRLPQSRRPESSVFCFLSRPHYAISLLEARATDSQLRYFWVGDFSNRALNGRLLFDR